MRSTIAFASLLAAAACVSASSSSHPVLAFTSQQASSTKLELPSDSSISSFVDSLFSAGKASPACSLAAIALVSANNLNRETFASLRYTSSQSLRGRSLDAPSQVTFSAQPDAEYADKLVSRAREVCTARKDVIDIVRINVNDLQQEGRLQFTMPKNVPQIEPLLMSCPTTLLLAYVLIILSIFQNRCFCKNSRPWTSLIPEIWSYLPKTNDCISTQSAR